MLYLVGHFSVTNLRPTFALVAQDADISPLPSPPPKGCPARFPGVTSETKLAVTKTLKENHINLHGFRNEQGLHK